MERLTEVTEDLVKLISGCGDHNLHHPWPGKQPFHTQQFTMATITSAKRVLAISKGLVTLSSKLSSTGEITNTRLGLVAASSIAAGTLVYRYALPWLQSENAILRQALEGGGSNPVDVDSTVVEHQPAPQREEVLMIGDVPLVLTDEVVPVEADAPVKRRIRKGCRGQFIREMVAAVKLRLGTPRCTMANRRAVQRVAREEMREFNLRKTVAASVIPLIVEATFVPSKWEVRAAEVSNSCLAQARKAKMAVLLEMAGFTTA